MSDLLQEFCTNRNVPLRIDRAAGLLRGVKLLGINSRNGREYPDAVLQRAARLYEGAKVNVNHPKGHPLAPRDYQDRLGTIHSVEARTGEGLFGDLQFNPKHALAEQLLWDAEHAPENVGFSHNVQARTAKRGEQVIVEDILAVQSVDLVADPATTRGLFENIRRAGDVNPPMTFTTNEADVDVGWAESAAADSAHAECAQALNEEAAPPPHAERVGLADSAHPMVLQPETRNLEPETACVVREQADEITRLRAELDQLKAAHATEHKRSTIAALLVEHNLPSLDRRDAAAKAITSDSFIESLLAAPNETAMRQLIRDRAALVEHSRRWPTEAHSRTTSPRSRDQTLIEGSALDSLGAFVKAIT